MSFAIEQFDILGSDLTSYAGRDPNEERTVLSVYYVGTVPQRARSLAAKITGVQVVLVGGARFTRAHLLDASWALGQDAALAREWSIKYVSPNLDGSGITVELIGNTLPDPDSVRAAAEKYGIPDGITFNAYHLPSG